MRCLDWGVGWERDQRGTMAAAACDMCDDLAVFCVAAALLVGLCSQVIREGSHTHLLTGGHCQAQQGANTQASQMSSCMCLCVFARRGGMVMVV